MLPKLENQGVEKATQSLRVQEESSSAFIDIITCASLTLICSLERKFVDLEMTNQQLRNHSDSQPAAAQKKDLLEFDKSLRIEEQPSSAFISILTRAYLH